MNPKKTDPKVDTQEVIELPQSKTTDAASADNPANRARNEQPRNNAASQHAAAPAGAFSRAPAGKPVEDSGQVEIIKAMVSEYTKGAGRASTDVTTSKKATRSLFTVIRTICTLQGKTLNRALGHLVSEIKNDTSGAFGKMMICRYTGDIESVTERNCFVRLITLLTTYANLENKSNLREVVDVEYCLALVKSDATRSQMNAFFK